MYDYDATIKCVCVCVCVHVIVRIDTRRLSSTVSALSSFARLSIGMTMSIPSQLCLHEPAIDVHTFTLSPPSAERASFQFPALPSHSRNCPALNDECVSSDSEDQLQNWIWRRRRLTGCATSKSGDDVTLNVTSLDTRDSPINSTRVKIVIGDSDVSDESW